MAGTVYLIPTFLSDEFHDVLSASSLSIIRELDEFVVENEKSARAFLKKIGTNVAQANFIFHELNEHSDPKSISGLAALFKKNKAIGLMSDAGCPAIADPGSEFVRMAHENNVKVIPIIGPSSIFLALMASGMNGQSFCFHGYLPRESNPRKQKLRDLEKDALKKDQTQMFIETPYRNHQMLGDILETLQPTTRLCIAFDLTGKGEFIKTLTIVDWKKEKIDFHKKPAIFILGK